MEKNRRPERGGNGRKRGKTLAVAHATPSHFQNKKQGVLLCLRKKGLSKGRRNRVKAGNVRGNGTTNRGKVRKKNLSPGRRGIEVERNTQVWGVMRGRRGKKVHSNTHQHSRGGKKKENKNKGVRKRGMVEVLLPGNGFWGRGAAGI